MSPLYSLNVKTLKNVNFYFKQTFASTGLRTLLVACRDLSDEEYESWEKLYREASLALANREELVQYYYNFRNTKKKKKIKEELTWWYSFFFFFFPSFSSF